MASQELIEITRRVNDEQRTRLIKQMFKPVSKDSAMGLLLEKARRIASAPMPSTDTPPAPLTAWTPQILPASIWHFGDSLKPNEICPCGCGQTREEIMGEGTWKELSPTGIMKKMNEVLYGDRGDPTVGAETTTSSDSPTIQAPYHLLQSSITSDSLSKPEAASSKTPPFCPPRVEASLHDRLSFFATTPPAWGGWLIS